MKETDRLLFNKAVFNRPDDSIKVLSAVYCAFAAVTEWQALQLWQVRQP